MFWRVCENWVKGWCSQVLVYKKNLCFTFRQEGKWQSPIAVSDFSVLSTVCVFNQALLFQVTFIITFFACWPERFVLIYILLSKWWKEFRYAINLHKWIYVLPDQNNGKERIIVVTLERHGSVIEWIWSIQTYKYWTGYPWTWINIHKMLPSPFLILGDSGLPREVF